MKEPQIKDFIPLDQLLPATSKVYSLSKLQESKDWIQINQWWQDKLTLLENENIDGLKAWLEILLLGACVGFSERNLNPELPAHQYIYPRMIQDVKDMYFKLKQNNADLESHELKWQVYDFGLQWVYYMDWDVYISQELY